MRQDAIAAYHVPAQWRVDLDGLPGFDAATGAVRLAHDAAQEQDRQGRALLYPGRAHPLTRRAIATARMTHTGRVSAARAETEGWLLTYAVEAGFHLRRVFGLRIDTAGSIREEPDILAFTAEASAAPAWPADRIGAARPVAERIAQRLFEAFVTDHAARIGRATAEAQAWLERRATALCGKSVAASGDLFGRAPDEPLWRQHAPAEQRLSHSVTDPSLPRERRQDAAEALRRFRAMLPPPAPLPRPMTRLIGVLHLCR